MAMVPPPIRAVGHGFGHSGVYRPIGSFGSFDSGVLGMFFCTFICDLCAGFTGRFGVEFARRLLQSLVRSFGVGFVRSFGVGFVRSFGVGFVRSFGVGFVVRFGSEKLLHVASHISVSGHLDDRAALVRLRFHRSRVHRARTRQLHSLPRTLHCDIVQCPPKELRTESLPPVREARVHRHRLVGAEAEELAKGIPVGALVHELAVAGDVEQIAEHHHLDDHDRVDGGAACFCEIGGGHVSERLEVDQLQDAAQQAGGARLEHWWRWIVEAELRGCLFTKHHFLLDNCRDGCSKSRIRHPPQNYSFFEHNPGPRPTNGNDERQRQRH
jgi:hypothetical protein